MTMALPSCPEILQGTTVQFLLPVSLRALEPQCWHFRPLPVGLHRVPVFLLCRWSPMPKPDLEMPCGFVSTPPTPSSLWVSQSYCRDPGDSN